MNRSQPQLFDTFNARFLDLRAITESFVPSVHFDELIASSHSLLVGPRGSGKTTLLKMLQPAAFAMWKHGQAARYRSMLNFAGVFIPADVSWGAQLNALGYGRLSPMHHRALSIAAFTTHVHRSLVETASSLITTVDPRSGRTRKIESAAQADAVRSISVIWRLAPEIPSFSALKLALSSRLVDIRLLANQGIHIGPDELNRRIAESEYLHVSVIDSVSAFVDVINGLLGNDSAKWALLFDELEIAPDWIQDELMRSLRSLADQRILFKLAISPVSSCARPILADALSPAIQHDVKEIRLWSSQRQEMYKFCRDLWLSVAKARGHSTLRPEVALGASYFSPEGPAQTKDPYGTGSEWARRFASLADKDRSFREYMSTSGVDPMSLHSAPIELRDSVIRKLAPIVAIREYFRAADDSGRELRSRKAETVYSGADSIFAASEGNPRWFIGIAEKLLGSLSPPDLRVSPATQAREISNTAERFLSMLATIPVSGKLLRNEDNPFQRLLDSIGEYFHARIVLDAFTPDPPLCFIVDESVGEQLAKRLEVLLNCGAIIYLPEPGEPFALKSLYQKRFRLSYLLATRYRLPLRLGKSIELSRILGGSEKANLDLFQAR